jgi:hypothetical protein
MDYRKNFDMKTQSKISYLIFIMRSIVILTVNLYISYVERKFHRHIQKLI